MIVSMNHIQRSQIQHRRFRKTRREITHSKHKTKHRDKIKRDQLRNAKAHARIKNGFRVKSCFENVHENRPDFVESKRF